MELFRGAAQYWWQNNACDGNATHADRRCAQKNTISISRLALIGMAGLCALPGLAHAAEPDRPDDYIGDLAKCQSLTDDPARLACYDEKVAAMVAARDAGTVRLVDREVVRRTRRELFGFALPNIGLLKDSDGASDAMETLQTTITSVRYQKSGDIRFTTEEGALWEIIKPPKRLTQVKAGDSVEFRKASMGTYFIRIGNQMGVRGKRLE